MAENLLPVSPRAGHAFSGTTQSQGGPIFQGDITAGKDVNITLSAGSRNEEQQKLLDWISPLNFWIAQIDVYDRCHEGTGGWFFDHPSVKKWLDGDLKTLFCPGIPGAGKTVLSSSSLIVQRTSKSLAQRDKVAVAVIYFNHKEQEVQTLSNLLSSLVQQLAWQSNNLPEDLKAAYHEHVRRGTRPGRIELRNLLLSSISRFDRCFLVIDGLDEATNGETRDPFVQLLKQLSQTASVLVTSRDLPPILQAFHDWPRLDIAAQKSDVFVFIQSVIDHSPDLADFLSAVPTLRQSVFDGIWQKCGGIFLLAQLHIRSIARQDNLDAVRNALQELPADLDVLYDQVMERISAQGSHDRRRAMQVLMWISCAARPLNVKELQHAIVAQSNPESIGQDVLPARSRLVAVCAGLVQIEPYSTVIRLVHETTQSYFEKNRDRYFPNAHSEITRACLSYLSFRAFSNGPCSRDEDFRLRLKEWGFFEYASRYWGKHAFGSSESPHLDAIETFMADERKLASSIQASYAPVSLSTHYPQPVGPIWVAASFGASSLLPRLVRKLRNNRLELVYMALHFAQSGGYGDTIQILYGTLKTMSVNVDLSTLTSWRIGESTLNHAIRSSHDEVVAALLQGEPELSRYDEERDQYYPPLFLAVSERREMAVKLLLRAGADTDVSLQSKPVLYLAVELVDKRYPKLDGAESRLAQPVCTPNNVSCPVEKSIFRMLLEHGASPDASWLAHTVLDVAAQVNDEGRIAEMLLNAGAAATKNTLEIAVSDGSARLVELLLKWIRNVEDKTTKSLGLAHRIDEISLLMSSKGTWNDLVVNSLGKKPFEDFLIHWARNGEDPPIQETALLHCVVSKSPPYDLPSASPVIISLLERGVSIESKSKTRAYADFTPLMTAAVWGYMSAVKTLLDRGANINASTPYKYSTALHLAAYKCHEEIVELLVRRGANVLAEDSVGLTPLDVALGRREEDRNPPAETLMRFDTKDNPRSRRLLVGWRSIMNVLEPATREAEIRARKRTRRYAHY